MLKFTKPLKDSFVTVAHPFKPLLTLSWRSFCQAKPPESLHGEHFEKPEVASLWACYRMRGQTVECRKAGMIPGMISDYDLETGMNHNELINLRNKEVWGHLTKIGKNEFMSRFCNLEIRSGPESEEVISKVRVFPRKLYLLNGRRMILNLAFVRVRQNVKLRMCIPLKFKGRTVCPGLIEGGTLMILKKGVSCFCLPDKVPQYIEVDASKLKIGERILLGDLNLDLQFKRQVSHVVCEIVKRYKTVKRRRPQL